MTPAAVPAALAAAVAARLESLEREAFGRRLLAGDPGLWPQPEIAAERLGWLRLPSIMGDELPAIEALASEVRAEGVKDVVVLGMGGSSLAPEVFESLLGGREGWPRLTVLDSTHPVVVAAHLDAFPVATSLYVIASKSGTTLETLSFFRTFWHQADGESVGRRFVAITDPGSPLADLASERGFRKLFLAPPDVGGRFSALSHFGLVPAGLVGADLQRLLDGARTALEQVDKALELGVLLGEAALARRDKVTFISDPVLAPFVGWLEQLLAESTGKEGKGLVPVFGEPPATRFGSDRIFVGLSLEGGTGEARSGLRSLEESGLPTVSTEWPDVGAVGGAMMRWQLATATAAAVMGLQPFDQPDVDLAKRLTRAAMEQRSSPEADDPVLVDLGDRAALERAMSEWLADAAGGDSIALQAFLPVSEEVLATLASLRAELAATGLPTTLGFGPRFLHSTGQLHKGGPAGTHCLQLIDHGGPQLAIPETGYDYRQLIDAQALGDARALAQRGRKVLRLRLGD
jgi:transaldolase/glucose-6-phosphate isomerase